MLCNSQSHLAILQEYNPPPRRNVGTNVDPILAPEQTLDGVVSDVFMNKHTTFQQSPGSGSLLAQTVTCPPRRMDKYKCPDFPARQCSVLINHFNEKLIMRS